MLTRHQSPPLDACALSWRDLYERGAFLQRELTEQGSLRRMGEDRNVRAGAGSERWESWDRLGVLRPIAFSTTGRYLRTRYRPAGDSEGLVFREEVEHRTWGEYAWDADGYPEVSDLFSPWQVLCLAGR